MQLNWPLQLSGNDRARHQRPDRVRLCDAYAKCLLLPLQTVTQLLRDCKLDGL